MTASPFDHPLLSGLFSDEEVAAYFSAGAELEQMLAFERALLAAQAKAGVIAEDVAEQMGGQFDGFEPDLEGLRRETARNGTVGVDYVRQLRAFFGDDGTHIHFGATSQDLVDTALILRLKPVAEILERRLLVLGEKFDGLEARFGANSLMGRTRMQPAMPIRAADRIRAWREPLGRHAERLRRIAKDLLVVQLGGPVGTRTAFGGRADAVAGFLADELVLGTCDGSWHNQRDRLVEFGGWCALVSGSLGKFGADISLMAQAADDELALGGGGGSSSMPHKTNPVAAEVLVALADFNATQASGIYRSMVHEQERSGAAWSLEWLILPQMVLATAGGLRSAAALADQIERIGTAA